MSIVDSKRGFTLVELLAAIVIIAILGVTAVAAYNGISKNAKEKAYEAKVKQIETAAAKWAEENNVNYKTQVSVNKLIVQGYLQADAVSDLGEALIENPVDGQNMICKVVDLSRKEGQYNADFVSSKENCNLANQAIYDEKIIVSAYGADGNKIDFNDNYLSWTNQNISLVVSSPDFDGSLVSISYDFDGDTITKNDSGLSKSDNKYQANADAYYNVYNVSADLILNNYVVITYTLNDGSIYSRTVVIRIDKENPTFVASTTNDWIAVDKPITIYADDGEGSGVKGFYISKDKDDLGTFYETDYKKTVNLTESGTYYVKVIDNVSNLSNADDKSGSIKVNNVDKTVPTCEIDYIGTLGDNDWYVTKVVPNIKSNEAGLSGLYYGYDTKDVVNYDSGHISNGDSLNVNLSEVGETTSKTYYCFVKSLAGKKGRNSKEVKVDIIKPTITSIKVSSQDTSYASEKVNVEISANDTTSGLWKMCLQDNNNINSCNWIDYKTTGKVTISNGNINGGTAYVYAWVKDKAGNVSEIKKSDGYSLYKNCTETVNDGTYTCGTYSGCTNVCGGGTEYATKTQKKKDKYTGATCSSVITESGCSQSCGGTNTNYTYGSWSSWSTCSDACGGTQTRTRTGYRYSTDGTKICSDAKTETDTQNCGGQATETCGDYGSFSTCSNVCGGTQTQSKTCTIKSKDGTKVCSTRTVENTVNCGGANVSCGSCSANSGATCSTTCGTGTKAGTKTCSNVSNIDGSYCSAAASQSCTVSCTDTSGCTKPSKPTITARRKYTSDDNYLKAGDAVASGDWSNGLNFTFSGSTATGGVGYQYSFDKSSWTTASTLSYTTVTSSKKIYVRAYNLIKTSLVSDIAEYTIKLETTKPTVTSFGSTSTCSNNKNPSGVTYPQQYGAGDWADSGGSGLKSVTMVYSFTYKSKSYCSYYFNSSLSGNSSPNQGYWVKYKGPTKFFLRVCDAAGNCVSTTGSSSCSGSVKKNISDGATYIDSCAAYIS